MKKLIALLTAAVMTLGVNVCAFAASDITVEVDSKMLQFDVPPQIINGRTMVPMRMIFEELGASVEWNGAERSIHAEKDGQNIGLKIDSRSMNLWTAGEGTTVKLDAPATIIDGRTLVPIRAIAEAFDCSVIWNGDTRHITITQKSDDLTVTQWDIYEEAEELLCLEEVSFSRQELEHELNAKYDYADIVLAINRMEADGKADWNEQAYKTALLAIHEETGVFSATTLRDFLVQERGFTYDQAHEGIRMLEGYDQVDWYQQAYRAGQFLMKAADRPYFHDEFKQALMNDFMFTEEHADYAIDMLDRNGESSWG